MNNQDRSLDDIQSEIRRTRGRLDATLSAVEQRLEPGQLLEQGVHYMRNHGVTEYFVSLGESAKRQPLPLAVAGVSLAWLMLSDSRRRVHSDQDHTRGSMSHSSSNTDSERGEASSTFKSTVHNAADKIAEKRDAAADTVADLRDKVSGAVTDTLDKVSHNAQRVKSEVKSGYAHLIEEQPLALGAIGLALGALLAASTPRTRREDRLMGSTSDRLVNDAKQFGREKVAQAKEATSLSSSESGSPDKSTTAVGAVSGSIPDAEPPRQKPGSATSGSAESSGTSQKPSTTPDAATPSAGATGSPVTSDTASGAASTKSTSRADAGTTKPKDNQHH